MQDTLPLLQNVCNVWIGSFACVIGKRLVEICLLDLQSARFATIVEL
jgi:hypothetical protein